VRITGNLTYLDFPVVLADQILQTESDLSAPSALKQDTMFKPIIIKKKKEPEGGECRKVDKFLLI